MSKQTQFRQGDVLITRVAKRRTPKGEKVEPRQGRVVLAYGEVTGHHHSIDARYATLTKETEEVSLLDIAEALAFLEHQEHATIELPPGQYEVTIQREYTPAGIRQVAD